MARPNQLPRAFAVLVLAALAGAGASCSTYGSVSLHDFLVEDTRLRCGTRVACDGVADEGLCERVLRPDSGVSTQELADLDSGKVVFDGVAAAECLDYRRRHEQDCDRSSRQADPGLQACRRIFKGTIPVGGACFTGSECQVGFCANSPCECGPDQASCCCVGTCTSFPGLGEPCVELCQEGFSCVTVLGTTTRRCERQREAGEACSAVHRCVSTVVCVQSEPGGTGLCGAPPAEGERCRPSTIFGCARDDDYCDPGEEICKRKLPLGASCAASGAPCVFNAACVGGKCALPPGEGEPCSEEPTFVFQCGWGLTCDNGVCEVRSTQPVDTFPVCK